MSDHRQGDEPSYKVYRSRRNPLNRLRPEGGLEGLRRRHDPRRPREPGEPKRPGQRISLGRVAKYAALALLGWLVLSAFLFLVSAQLQGGVSENAEEALSPGGSIVTGTTILVIGSDQRPKETATTGGEGGRADSIMLLRASLGSLQRLSILRDSFVPDLGEKINAAYAIGGEKQMINTVESFMGNGLEVNHVIEVNFRDFPELVDSMGGIDVENKSKICSPQFDPFKGPINFRKGEIHLSGRQALAFARVRKNDCAPAEDDRNRAKRQQEVVTGIRSRVLSPSGFLRLPWISWKAPKTITTDMGGPSLMTLFGDIATAGSQDSAPILTPSGAGPGGSLLISDEAKRSAVNKLLGKK